MQLNDYEVKHNTCVRELAPECTLFLRKDGSFPVKEIGKAALFGSGARKTIRGGTGSGEVYSRFSVSFEQGFSNAGIEVTTKAWLDAYDDVCVKAKEQWVKDMKASAKARHVNPMLALMGAVMSEPDYDLPLDGEGDICVYVLSRISGEGNDRKAEKGDVLLSDTEVRDIEALNRKFDRFVLVLNVGGPVDLSPVNDVKNILLFSQLGNQAGDILVDILTGKANPSGKLTTTWSAWADYQTVGDFGGWDDAYYKEGVYVGYRYFDSVGKKALYPFGFGLSYTDFDLKTREVRLDGTKVCMTASLTNVGSVSGKEVVQVYVSVPEGKLDQPYQALAGFAKSEEIMPGETKDVVVSFDMAELSSYDSESERYLLEKGDYIVRVGNSSVNTTEALIVRLDETAVLRTARNMGGDCGFEDWKPEKKREILCPAGVPVIGLSASSFETEETVYDRDYDIDPIFENFTDEELCYLNIGYFREKGGLLSIIGDASAVVAGAAGDTCHKFEDRGVKAMVCADGPAGIRISQHYFVDAQGIHNVENNMIDMLSDFLPKIAVKLMKHMGKKPKKGQTIYDQYCTMIPIGTAIAQSFNVKLAETCGDLVGDEMERFHVNFWLTPAMNIHRSILCGRNFEYYSEDPLVSGRFAAAITKGVQTHKGCATTIKHYAVNNQETNRYGMNSHVSERALRDIYLKGFGIAIRESKPHSVMTSYNLLNGEHTSGHRGLIDDMLRAEYGFDGIVMTDWIVSMMMKGGKYEAPHSWHIAAAGGDVMMPGSKHDFDELKQGLADGKVTRKQLMINATRLYRMGQKLIG